MRDKLQWLLAVIGTASLLLAVVTGVGALQQPAGPPLEFASVRFDLPHALIAGQEYAFPVPVQNQGSQPARLIGALEYCGGACYSVVNLPVTVPARGRGSINVHIKANRAAPLDEDVTFFTDQPTQPTLTLRIHGTIIEQTHDVAEQTAAR